MRATAHVLCVTAVLVAALWAAPAAAQGPGEPGPTTDPPAAPVGETGGTLRVAIRDIPPFAVGSGGEWTGYSVDLWEQVAEDLSLDTEYVEVASVAEQLEAVEAGAADVAVGAVSITEERERVVDFSKRIYDSGVGILVSDSLRGGNTLRDVAGTLLTRAVVGVVVLIVLLVVVAGHVVWVVERRRNTDHFPRAYLPGVAQGMWWAAVTMTTVGYGDTVTHTRGGRLVSVAWMLIALVVLAQFTGTIASVLTQERLESTVDGVEDLYGREVATVAGTTSADWLAEIALPAQEVADVDVAVQLLLDGDVDAVVFDEPVLRREANTTAANRSELVDRLYRPQGIGFAFPEGSTLVEPVDVELLALWEDETVGGLADKWFGEQDG
jgi:ABC-type amino acid transport substrate-binding protein